ncbi:helix-turn-helix domain-containing protein [Kitasatospora sp. RB6PN24]|uniref:winged helix-turn-helix domain-containing protein n=1 Tax=Kitasatospora humi TaxID=2893891 RepID=UPI001E5C81B7|nr:helix-turn-helix domain-containing protein [Kitasatospora humi]MCC9306254.1 helix-turn-helix domain-containing protein [Kitasatospora humi]
MSSEEARPAPERPSGAGRPLRQLTDPKTMRAVAHPTRLALLEALNQRDPLTATEAAEMIGESPTNCAFHLRTLAKYGFVEEAGGGPGRRRPWRLKHIGFVVDDSEGETETAHAAEALAKLLWETWLGRVSTVNARRSEFKGPWQQVTSGTENVAYVTPEEAQQLNAELRQLLDRYRERLEEPSRRPTGSLPVEMVLFTYPLEATRPEA